MTLFSSATISRAVVVLAAAVIAAGVAVVHAQQPSGPPNALQGFSQNRDKPIKINAASLEVRDNNKMATFAGDVHLVQGDVSLRSDMLVVFYDEEAPVQPQPAPSKDAHAPAAAAQITPQQIKRVEAKGNVLVVQKDLITTGNLVIFDMRANTAEMSGNVVLAKGPNTLGGDGLTVNMITGESRMTADRSEKLFIPWQLQRSESSR